MPGIIPPIIPPIIGFIIPGPIIPGANMIAVERWYRYEDESRNPAMSSKEATIRQTQPCRYYITKRDRGQRKIGRQLCNSLGTELTLAVPPNLKHPLESEKAPSGTSGTGKRDHPQLRHFVFLVSPRRTLLFA